MYRLKSNDTVLCEHTLLGNLTSTDPDPDPHTHPTKVICYCREEDDTFTIRVEVDLITGETSRLRILNTSDNPSQRRQGVSILINPENSDKFYLDVYEHKGLTFLNTTKKELCELKTWVDAYDPTCCQCCEKEECECKYF